MTGVVIYRGRRNIRHTIDGALVTVSPQDRFKLPLFECIRIVDTDNRFITDEPTTRKIKSLRMGGQQTDVITGMLEDQDCFIVGRGPSLKGFDFELIKDKFTIALNDAFDSVIDPDGVCFVDADFVTKRDGEYEEKLANYDGFIFAAPNTCYEAMDKRNNVYIFPINRNYPQTNIFAGVFNGQLSGLASINLALIMNAKRIFLLGYDLDPHVEKTHFDTDAIKTHYLRPNWVEMRMKQFRKFEEWKDRIYNCNPNSYLDIFNYKDINEVL